jgi:membrane protease YdiL (CAAX protease family)
MALVGAVWAFWTRGSVFSLTTDAPWLAGSASFWGLGVWCGLAIALALWIVAMTRVLVQRTAWARRLHLALRIALLGLSPGRIAQLALLSAAAEELFFRAALAPSLGLFTSALVFGLLHVSPQGTGFAWSLWAMVMGLLFGGLFLGSGSLLPALLAHALINYENMHYLCNYDPTPLDMDRAGPQDSRRETV